MTLTLYSSSKYNFYCNTFICNWVYFSTLKKRRRPSFIAVHHMLHYSKSKPTEEGSVHDSQLQNIKESEETYGQIFTAVGEICWDYQFLKE